MTTVVAENQPNDCKDTPYIVGSAQVPATAKRGPGRKPKILRRGWKEVIAKAALTATTQGELRNAHNQGIRKSARSYLGRNAWERIWADDSSGLRDLAETVWRERRNPVVQQIIDQAKQGDMAAIDRFMKHVDPVAKQEAREAKAGAGNLTVNVTGEGAQIAILAPPQLPRIDAYLAEKGLIPDDTAAPNDE